MPPFSDPFGDGPYAEIKAMLDRETRAMARAFDRRFVDVDTDYSYPVKHITGIDFEEVRIDSGFIKADTIHANFITIDGEKNTYDFRMPRYDTPFHKPNVHIQKDGRAA